VNYLIFRWSRGEIGVIKPSYAAVDRFELDEWNHEKPVHFEGRGWTVAMVDLFYFAARDGGVK
jgi:hypothetical protein